MSIKQINAFGDTLCGLVSFGYLGFMAYQPL